LGADQPQPSKNYFLTAHISCTRGRRCLNPNSAYASASEASEGISVGNIRNAVLSPRPSPLTITSP